MNIVRKLTLRHLKENKGRTVVTILGIIVAVAMITAVFVGSSSLLNVTGQMMKYTTGDYDFTASAYNDDSTERIEGTSKIKNDGELKKVGTTYKYNYAVVPQGKENDPEVMMVDLREYDYNCLEMVMTNEFTGKLPTNENEILVQKSYIDDNKLSWKVGDKVTLEIGNYYDKTTKEERLYDDAQSDNIFKKHETKVVTVTGIMTDDRSTALYSENIVFGHSGSFSKENFSNIDVYCKLNNVGFYATKQIDKILDRYSLEESFDYNTDYLLSQGALAINDTTAVMIISIIIMLIIIITASVMLVYNAFSMSLTGRLRYLGMLASVGATRKQKRNSVYFEGAFLGLIAIPLGIFFGIIGIDITLNVVLNRLITSGALGYIKEGMITSILSVPAWSIISIIVFSIITIFISAYIPARKSSKISPIDAIRQNDSINLKAKSLKSSKLIRKIFGYEGEIANKNLKRNGKKSRLIIVSLTISIVLFITVNYFCSMFTTQVDGLKKESYQVEAALPYNEAEKFNEEIAKDNNIKDKFLLTSYSIVQMAENKDKYLDYMNFQYKRKYKESICMMVHLVEDDTFNKICKDNNIDKSKYYGKKLLTLAVNSVGDKSSEDPVFKDSIKNYGLYCDQSDLFAGGFMDDSIYEDNYKLEGHILSKENNIYIGDFIKYDENNLLFTMDDNSEITMFAPMSEYLKVTNNKPSDMSVTYGYVTDNSTKLYDTINNLSSDYTVLSVSNYEHDRQGYEAVRFTIQVFLYGFITLITLITIFNIINTISTGTAMRKREFAMLRSVGVSKKGFYKIVCLESLLYGIKALIIGLPLSLLISYGMHISIGEAGYPFRPDIMIYLIVVVAVFLIVGLTMFYAVNKIKKGSIIDALKEDID
ncbi:ABC transporter permease [Ruminococcus bovis]|uniref:ABC transporter permease n=1 Tax=Ruminococcus bovis TaxID=2564099 RepID=A0A4P8XU99_9FIRM|nr:ABC transporter permease [Ruminococcus bovis]QCT06182.1 ABC transporter permease [Ruminococcus bovis]